MAPIEGIKLGFKLADLAKSQGKKFTNIKLKNNAELNILKMRMLMMFILQEKIDY